MRKACAKLFVYAMLMHSAQHYSESALCSTPVMGKTWRVVHPLSMLWLNIDIVINVASSFTGGCELFPLQSWRVRLSGKLVCSVYTYAKGRRGGKWGWGATNTWYGLEDLVVTGRMWCDACFTLFRTENVPIKLTKCGYAKCYELSCGPQTGIF